MTPSCSRYPVKDAESQNSAETPKYSVLMSLYGRERSDFLRLALDSMMGQTIPPDEIVLVEDGPLPDALHEIIRECSDRNPGLFTILVNPSNLGLGLSLRKGVEACKNELIARMDTDDIAFPDRCKKQLLYFVSHPVTAILGGQIQEFVDSPDSPVGRRQVPESDADLKQFMRKRCPFNHMTVMFKKSDVLAAGNYRDWFWNEDYDLWIRLALRGCTFANLPDVLVSTRVGRDMYSRRGGLKYFVSECRIQMFMKSNRLVSWPLFLANCLKRFIVELLLPSRLRSWVFQTFARTPLPQDSVVPIPSGGRP